MSALAKWFDTASSITLSFSKTTCKKMPVAKMTPLSIPTSALGVSGPAGKELLGKFGAVWHPDFLGGLSLCSIWMNYRNKDL